MLDLKNKADLLRLVDEGLEESLTLDYKASPSLSRDGKHPEELCKDVSALANSAVISPICASRVAPGRFHR